MVMASSGCNQARPVRTLLVANRGEIARRIMATCTRMGITTVAVFSDADEHAPHTREADHGVRLPGNSPADTYLRVDLIIAAARRAGADAIHPGYGFLSENAEFARAVTEAGITWIGPSASTIETMGSKTLAKQLMTSADVPILEVDPAGARPDDFPLLVKASAGGGGRGMRVIASQDTLEAEMRTARTEAHSAFGDDTVFLEPYLPAARHIEVQVLADTHGTVWILGDRDCSIQRRHQKVVEEAPAPDVSDPVRAGLHNAARAAAETTGYIGAGTVEFLVTDASQQDGQLYFLEMNTRLQVEHPVTEAIFGIDLVEQQIHIAEGGHLPATPPDAHGHAVEVRIYAEDPRRDYQPQAGTLRRFHFTDHASIRLDAGVEPGSVVSTHYDAMLGKLIASAPSRPAAVRVLAGALTRAQVSGVTTNLSLLRAILTSDEFGRASLHTGLLEERLDAWMARQSGERGAIHLAEYATAAALAQACWASENSPVQNGVPTAFRNVAAMARRRTYDVDETRMSVDYAAVRGHFHVVDHDDLTVEFATAQSVRLARNGVTTTYRIDHASEAVDVHGPHGSQTLVPVPDFADPQEQLAAGSLLAPMPGTVTAVPVNPGEHVTRGTPVVVLEAMKMQHTIAAPADGIVADLHASTGAQVDAGALLAVIDETGSD